ncbi:MAG: phage/plasmid primase, P4 family [Nitrospirota bacterium]
MNQSHITFREVSQKNPCPICGKPDWCSFSKDGAIVCCRRVDNGQGKYKTDKSGNDYWVYLMKGSHPKLDTFDLDIAPKPCCADSNALHKVYSALLNELHLEPSHKDNILNRGLSDEVIQQGQYRSLPQRARSKIARKLVERFGEEIAYIPGFIQKEGGNGRYWTLAGCSGLLIPVRDAQHRIIALKIRADEDKDDFPKYTYFSSSKFGGASSGSPIHVPLFNGSAPEIVRLTEGELKADVTTFLTHILTISVPGASIWKPAIPILKSLDAKIILLAFDADYRENPHVARALLNTYRTLQEEGFVVEVEAWGLEQGKGIDDVLLTGHIPKRLNNEAAQTFIKSEVAAILPETQPVCDDLILDCLCKDERGDAELLAALCDGRKLFNHTTTRWVSYDEGVWQKDEKKQTRKEGLFLLSKTYLELSSKVDRDIVHVQEQSVKKGGISEEEKQTIAAKEKLRDSLRDRSRKLNKRARIDNVLELATSYLPAITTEFDIDPYLLNLVNGTFDLKADTFRDHSAQDRLSKRANVVFDPQARCEFWPVFLQRIFADNHDLIKFIQRCVGYSLTGLVDLQILFFCHGKGANGKTTFFTVLKILLGDYYTTIPIESLLMKMRDNTTEYQLAKLFGARVVVASEIPQGRRLQESQVKDLTGGEPINARNPFEKPFTFEPSHKLWLFGNHKPIIRGTDEGIWRRVHLIPFLVMIPKSQQRPMSTMLAEFRSEPAGILNWALEGYRDFQAHGLQTPGIVETATKEYREESDILGLFLTEKCTLKTTEQCKAKDLYQEYQKWCDAGNEIPVFHNMRQFVNTLRERGYQTFVGGHEKTTLVQGIGIQNVN